MNIFFFYWDWTNKSGLMNIIFTVIQIDNSNPVQTYFLSTCLFFFANKQFIIGGEKIFKLSWDLVIQKKNQNWREKKKAFGLTGQKEDF